MRPLSDVKWLKKHKTNVVSLSPVPATVHALHVLRRDEVSTFFPRRLASTRAHPRNTAFSAVGVSREKKNSIPRIKPLTPILAVFEVNLYVTRAAD